jgi:16S rRNA (guanine966-N2)-methyltransferase
MPRIVAGFAGSLTLVVPASGTRPTSDHVREAVFGSLDAADLVRGARVLDLYAGSGALGLEAASRGAMAVTLVDRSPDAVRSCRRNVATVLKAAPSGARPGIEIAPESVSAFLRRPSGPWDLAFLDPPYDLDEAQLSAELNALEPLLAPEARVIVERASRSPEPGWPATLRALRSKRYGDTVVWTAQPAPPSQPE